MTYILINGINKKDMEHEKVMPPGVMPLEPEKEIPEELTPEERRQLMKKMIDEFKTDADAVVTKIAANQAKRTEESE